MDEDHTCSVSEEVWSVVEEGEAFTGVAAARGGEATVCVYNRCEIDWDFLVYVEPLVTRTVVCVSDWRCSIGRMAHAMSELRSTRVGSTANVCTDCRAHGVLDFKGGVSGMSPDASYDECSNYEPDAVLGASE